MAELNRADGVPSGLDSRCKGCMDVDTGAEVERLWKRMKLREGEAVSDAVYAQRIAACEACEALLGGATCRHCGCLVRYRARLTDGVCPRPGGSRWEAAHHGTPGEL